MYIINVEFYIIEHPLRCGAVCGCSAPIGGGGGALFRVMIAFKVLIYILNSFLYWLSALFFTKTLYSGELTEVPSLIIKYR